MIKSIREYFRGVATEVKKITWPSRQEIISHTATVVVAIIVATAIFGAIDLGLSKLIERFVIFR